MRKYILISLVYIVSAVADALCPAGFLHAQDYSYTPIKVSEEKVKVGGKTFYSHIVMERQTLYGISKAYGVSIEDIHKFNPSVKENGLKKNAIILIPVQEQRQARLDSLTSANSKTEPPKIQSQRIHVKKWYETIEDIAAEYDVSPEAILKANGLEGKKIGKRVKLIIPPADVYSSVPVPDKTEPDSSTAVQEADTTKTGPLRYIPKTEIAASLLLPLKAVDSTSSRNNMDFYSGVLLAIHDMAEKGIGTSLSVNDIAWNLDDVSNAEIAHSDFVIGPVSTADISTLFSGIPQAKAVISPLDPRAESLTGIYSGLIQAPTPQKIQYSDLVKWLQVDFREGEKIVFITEKGARQTDAESMMAEVLTASSLPFDTFSYSILEGRDVLEPLTALMAPEQTNRIVVASDSEAFVNDVVRNLNLLIYNKLDIVLYAPSKIRNYETIEAENLHNTQAHICLSYYIDYEDRNVMDFLLKYRALFNMEPNQFAFQGYDIAGFFISLCAEYGNDWIQMLDKTDRQMLQTTFMFRRNGDHGYVNHGTRRIIYERGWKITNVSGNRTTNNVIAETYQPLSSDLAF